MTLTRLDHHPQEALLAAAYEGEPGEQNGEVFTRRWVVELILDLCGYTADQDLAVRTLIEPAAGDGAFLRVIAERVSASCRAHDRDLASASSAVVAYELVERNADVARSTLTEVFRDDGWAPKTARRVAASWLKVGDYLLDDFTAGQADLVVGNPPYVRLEDVPPERSAAYRRQWQTMSGRADIFIGFIERGLRSLRSDGKLGFICADRWMRNQYGKDLRELIADRFSVDVVITMHDVDAFESQVSAYPAVTVLSNRIQGPAVAVDTTSHFGEAAGAEVLAFTADQSSTHRAAVSFQAARLPHWFTGSESWPQGSPERLAMIEHLTDHFPLLQDPATGTRVGIGVATGADTSFVVDGPVDVEPDRLLPLALVRDLATGHLRWSGHYLVSPWQDDGLVDLDDYPKLRRYYESCGGAIRARFVATKTPTSWYRTIDRVDTGLTARSKLLIPDMRMTLHPVLDEGTTYPHHNLYTVTSTTWDLRVLGGLLLAETATAFIEAYAVKMRGGTLRFQAQYLRRIRVPKQGSVSAADARALAVAFDHRDVGAATQVALRLYGLDHLPE